METSQMKTLLHLGVPETLAQKVINERFSSSNASSLNMQQLLKAVLELKGGDAPLCKVGDIEDLLTMHNETYRLHSFAQTWRPQYAIKSVDAARAGFYYIGAKDRVKCAFCGCELHNWQAGDTPQGEHRKHSPQCPFLADPEAAGNVSVGGRQPSFEREEKTTPSQKPTNQPKTPENTHEEWPYLLSKMRMNCLDKSSQIVTNCMKNPDKIADSMEIEKVISREDLHRIKGIVDEKEKIKMILDLLRKADDNQYDTFCAILMAVDQGSLAKKLTPDGIDISDKGVLLKRDVIDRSSVVFKISPERIYRFQSLPRGRAIIINNMVYHHMKYRKGSDVDAKNLEKFFSRVGLDTQIIPDLTAEKMEELIKEEADRESHKKADAFVLVVLSHGNKGIVYGTDGRKIQKPAIKPTDTETKGAGDGQRNDTSSGEKKESYVKRKEQGSFIFENYLSVFEDIVDKFDGKRCPGLIGKPKLFFMQACQGGDKTVGVAVDSSTQSDTDATEEEEDLDVANHEKADILLCLATVDGFVSFRHPDEGTWFIQDLCQVFNNVDNIYDDILSMMREVKYRMQHRSTSSNKFLQMCETRDTLTKAFYFNPPYQAPQ